MSSISKAAIAEYRVLLKKELDAKQAIFTNCEARLPELKSAYDARRGELDGHMKEVYVAGLGANHPLQLERDRLHAERQEAYDALSACESELARNRPRVAELARLLGAEAAVEELTERHAAALANASTAERKIASADDMLTAIEAERAGRAERRQQIADANAQAQIEHAEAAVLARSEGKPIPEAPTVRRPAKGDESDGDLESQHTAAMKLKDKYTAELATLVEDLANTRNALMRVRFDAAEFRLEAALFGIKGERLEYEAAREFAGFHGREVKIHIDDIAVRARVNALGQEMPKWLPAAKRTPATQEPPMDAAATTEAAAA